MYTHDYLSSLSATQILDLIDESGFPSLSEALSMNEGTRQNHIDDLARCYYSSSEDEFSFSEWCQVEQLLFTYFDLTNYQPTKRG